MKTAMIFDTAYGENSNSYIEKIEDFGFKKIYDMIFSDNDIFSGEEINNRYWIYWRDGILLEFDTYCEERINSANFFTNWKIDWKKLDPRRRFDYTSSGHFVSEDVWVGDWDARENIKYKIDCLEKFGKILVPWVENDINWLINYKENKSTSGLKDWNPWRKKVHEITMERFRLFPQEIKECIGKFEEPSFLA